MIIASELERVKRDEVGRIYERIGAQRLDDAREIVATEAGRRLLHWLIYEAGGLQRIAAPEDDGRRKLAAAVYQLIDAAQPGAPEEIALESRKQRIANEASIASAIANRRHEYER